MVEPDVSHHHCQTPLEHSSPESCQPVSSNSWDKPYPSTPGHSTGKNTCSSPSWRRFPFPIHTLLFSFRLKHSLNSSGRLLLETSDTNCCQQWASILSDMAWPGCTDVSWCFLAMPCGHRLWRPLPLTRLSTRTRMSPSRVRLDGYIDDPEVRSSSSPF